MVSLGDGTARDLMDGVTAKLAPSGDLVFVDNGTLYRVDFDLNRLALRDTPAPLLEGVLETNNRRALFDVSNTGTLTYVHGGAAQSTTALVWLDRRGAATPAVQEPGRYLQPRLSPDGRRVAVSITGRSGNDIWVVDLDRETRLPVTTGGGNARPGWSPDGSAIAYQSGSDIHMVPASGGTATPLVVTTGNQFPDTWTPDGTTLIYNEGGALQTRNLWMMRVGEAQRPILDTQFGERGARVPISPSGGWQPVWSRDGKELFFRQEDWMMSPVQLEPFRMGAATRLFQFERRIYGDNINVPNYDVGPDGRFLAVRQSADQQSEIRIIVNWTEELKRRKPTN